MMLLKHKGRIYSFVGFAISAALLWHTVHKSGADIRYVLNNQTGWKYLLFALGVFLFSLYIKAFSFKLLFVHKLPLALSLSSFPSIMLANFYSAILPGNAGEAVRLFHFSRKNGYSLIYTAGAMITEKLSIGAMMCLLLFMFCLAHALQYGSLSLLLGALLMGVFLVLCGLLLFLWKPKPFAGCIPFKAVRKLCYKVVITVQKHFVRLKKENLLWPYFLLHLLLYLSTVCVKFVLFSAVDLPAEATTFKLAWYYTFVAMIAMFIPSAPSSVGVVHFSIYQAVIITCAESNIPVTASIKEAALSLAIWFHLSYLIPDLVVGSITALMERKVLYSTFSPSSANS